MSNARGELECIDLNQGTKVIKGNMYFVTSVAIILYFVTFSSLSWWLGWFCKQYDLVYDRNFV